MDPCREPMRHIVLNLAPLQECKRLMSINFIEYVGGRFNDSRENILGRYSTHKLCKLPKFFNRALDLLGKANKVIEPMVNGYRDSSNH